MPRITLEEQIAQLESSGPADFDPENEFEHVERQGDDDLDIGDDNAAAREHYVPVEPSAIRRLQESVSDSKYDGVRISRQKIFEDDTEPDSDSEIASDDRPFGSLTLEGNDQESGDRSNNEEGNDGEGEIQDEDENEEEEDEPEAYISGSDWGSRMVVDELPLNLKVVKKSRADTRQSREIREDAKPTGFTTSLRNARNQDRLKGKAVSQQLSLWDSILDARIRLQKGVTSAHSLPSTDDLVQFTSTRDGQKAANAMLAEALRLSDRLFELQEELLSSNEDISFPPRKRRKVGDEADSDAEWEKDINESTKSLASMESSSHAHWLQTLNKWSLKIQAVAPTALLPSKRTSFRQVQPKGAVQLVEDALTDGKLIERTRVRRAGDKILGHSERADELKTANDKMEVFDDTDFYQQLLRDVIDDRKGREGLSIGDPGATKNKKIKKVVDTKATKGRKLRYEVHEKIQHFMVPVPAKGAWHEEQIDELFASLLGKTYGGLNVPGSNGSHPDTIDEESLSNVDGLRVFG